MIGIIRVLRAACIAVSLSLAVSSAYAQSALEIQQQVESMMNSELRAPDYLNVTVQDGGRVFLQVELSSNEEAARVKKKVEDIEGVSEVVIEVKMP